MNLKRGKKAAIGMQITSVVVAISAGCVATTTVDSNTVRENIILFSAGVFISGCIGYVISSVGLELQKDVVTE